MIRRLRVLALASVALFVACSTNDVTVTAEDSGTTVRLEVGQTLKVELDENQSTGFLWNITETPDARVLDPTRDDYEVEGDAPGSPGTHTWEYEAAAPGSTTLSMQNYFQDEPERQGSDPFSIEIVVTPAGG